MVRIAISLLPVFIFLAFLIYLDSFKLVKISFLINVILIGCAAAIISYFLNRFLLNNLAIEVSTYTRYISPVIEELLKASFIIYLLSKNKIGFMVDAAIYGFAVGAGFATDRVQKLIEISEKAGAIGAAQNMLGEAVHALVVVEKMADVYEAFRKLLPEEKIITSKIDFQGARIE